HAVEHAPHGTVDLPTRAEDDHLQVLELYAQLVPCASVAVFLPFAHVQRRTLALGKHAVELQVEVQVRQVDTRALAAALTLDRSRERAVAAHFGLLGQVLAGDFAAPAAAERAQVLEHRVAHDHRRPDAEGVL